MAFVIDRRQCITVLFSIVVGQILSAVLSGTNIFINEVITRGLIVQIFPNEILYHILLILSLLLLPISCSFFRRIPRQIVLVYAILGCVDFGANVAVVKSFSYMSSVSVMVITSTSAIFAMFMAMLVFKRQYNRLHYLGAGIVVFGLAFINASRYLAKESDDKDREFWLGMTLALTAAIAYALSNTVNEYVCRFEKGYPIGALGGMGFFGSIISAMVCHLTQYGRNDRDSILGASWHLQALLSGYVACMFVFYLAVPWFIQTYSAVHLNFNMLTADVFVLVYNLIFHHDTRLVTPVYLTGFVLVLIGLAVFNLYEPVDGLTPEKSDENSLGCSIVPTSEPNLKSIV